MASLLFCLLATAGCFTTPATQPGFSQEDIQRQARANEEAGRKAQEAEAQQHAEYEAHPWRTESQPSKVDGSTNFVAVRSANRPFTDAYGKGHNAQLSLRCEEQQLKVQLFASAAFSMETIDYTKDQVSIGLRIDDQPVVELMAKRGSDQSTAFLPEPRKLVESLRTASHVTVYFTPRRLSRINANFPLADVATVLAQLDTHCPKK